MYVLKGLAFGLVDAYSVQKTEARGTCREAGRAVGRDIPFRTIIIERGTWQYQVSSFLLKALNLLEVHDPFLTKNSDEVFGFFRGNHEIGNLFSVDVSDLFYSVPHPELLRAVKQCIEDSGEATFVSKTEMSSAKFCYPLRNISQPHFRFF